MAVDLNALHQDVLARLGDTAQQIWTATEIDVHLHNAYQQIAQVGRVFWDWLYLENLPTGFSYTAKWEKASGIVAFDFGCGNFTITDERAVNADEPVRIGPAWYTAPFEATDGWLSAAKANTAISATADVPDSLTEISRGVWDRRGIHALTPKDMAKSDARYELTPGEVYGYLWQKDGVRTIRKVRVPQAQCDTVTITDGNDIANVGWGILRNPNDLSSDTPVIGQPNVPRSFNYTQRWESGLFTWTDEGQANYTLNDERPFVLSTLPPSGPAWFTAPAEFTDGWLTVLNHATAIPSFVYWGIPRRIPGQHPIGTEMFGTPRRPYLDGKNFRLEHWRQGRDLAEGSELPDRYAVYLKDFALAHCLSRTGPGQDLTLAKHFEMRWARDIARIKRRAAAMFRQRTGILGNAADRLIQRPARPVYPWPYGEVVR